MSASYAEYHKKHGKRWRMIVGEEAYKDAIDTLEQTGEPLKVMDKSPAELKGVGEILIAQQQGYLQALNDLAQLAQVPAELTNEMPPETYPDPEDEIEVDIPRLTRRR